MTNSDYLLALKVLRAHKKIFKLCYNSFAIKEESTVRLHIEVCRLYGTMNYYNITSIAHLLNILKIEINDR